MPQFLKEIYGVGILFFYYVKYIILIGWPVLLYGLDYKPNIIMDILWVYCLALMTKDIIFKFVFKKSHCDDSSCSSKNKK
ncbi:hypothetical protein MNB_SV-8-628 [hydrothermal vent metagenome]|uniref:Uncharacterized protein n=1 Tax=hydrothermal vent metagenome TaxID=652676 RepID=A0A1W1CA74_9ZZZZ